MMPFVLFRIIINVVSKTCGTNVHDMDVPWIVYHVMLTAVLAFSYGLLVFNLKKHFEDDYNEIRWSLLLFFVLEITFYIFFMVCHA